MISLSRRKHNTNNHSVRCISCLQTNNTRWNTDSRRCAKPNLQHSQAQGLILRHQIIVVGAGPSGLLLCLLLAKHGIPVVLLEASDDLDDRPRAAIYGPPAIPDLKRAGILDEVRRQGMIAGTMAWWRMASDHSEPLARLDGSVLEDVDGEDLRTTCLVLDQLDRLMLDEFLTKYKGEIKWRHKVVDVQQDDGAVSVEVETPTGRTRITGDYVVGCDGATSQVRKSLFDEFPGFTWDKQIVATNVRTLMQVAIGISI
jgi:2-polyprenyl-6-methoxyphenol hydroxylase-like FAD-dependent oxidoreductase